MKIIILAAGKGERLLPLTRNTPKPLLDMGKGKTLLEKQIESILDSGVIDEIVLVLGYLAEQVEAKVQFYQKAGQRVRSIYNPFYNSSNNLISMWLARHEMDSPFMLTNGDNLFTSDVFKEMVEQNKHGIFLATSKKENYDEDDMKVILRKQLVEKLGKDLDPNLVDAEAPGLLMVDDARLIEQVKSTLDRMVRSPINHQVYWPDVINKLAEQGISVQSWMFDGNTKWREMDVHMDIEQVKKMIAI